MLDTASGDEAAVAVLVTVTKLITVAVDTVAGLSLDVTGDTDADTAELERLMDPDTFCAAEVEGVGVELLATDEGLGVVVPVGPGRADPPRKGVGTTVEFGLGGGSPPGYESSKISS